MAQENDEPTDDVEPVQSKGTLTSKAYRELLDRIMRLELAPGASFSESEMASELELSKTPVREALVMLMGHRFVTVQRRSGYVVTPITLREARDLFAVRQILEPAAAAMAADASLSAMRLESLRDLAAAAADPDADVDAVLRANSRFHHNLVGATHNHQLLRALQGVNLHTRRLYRLIVELHGRPDEIRHDHTDLLEAVAAGRADVARQIVEQDLERSYKWAFDALMSADVLQSTNIGTAVDNGDDEDVD
ncbi:MAG TPA: GntR family transcriptional regulator [Nitriliruptorales bacterium]